jgi:hypothetical protein
VAPTALFREAKIRLAWSSKSTVGSHRRLSTPSADVTVLGNVGRNLGVDGPGIVVEDCEDVSVRGNVVRDVDGPGVVCRGEQSAASDLTVSGNLTAASSGRS